MRAIRPSDDAPPLFAEEEARDVVDEVLGERPLLVRDVVDAKLRKLSDPQLRGRLAWYERDFLSPHSPARLAEIKRERDRTRKELKRRERAGKLSARSAERPPPSNVVQLGIRHSARDSDFKVRLAPRLVA